MFNLAYERGPYRRALDYTQPPRPLLAAELAEWGRERVSAAGLSAE